MDFDQLSLADLKAKSPADLIDMAEELEIENASTMRKGDMMFAILKELADSEVEITGQGVLEVLTDGFGFLRALDTAFGQQVKGCSVLIVGAGGADLHAIGPEHGVSPQERLRLGVVLAHRVPEGVGQQQRLLQRSRSWCWRRRWSRRCCWPTRATRSSASCSRSAGLARSRSSCPRWRRFRPA